MLNYDICKECHQECNMLFLYPKHPFKSVACPYVIVTEYIKKHPKYQIHNVIVLDGQVPQHCPNKGSKKTYGKKDKN